jgi:hypothetical protein
MFKMNKNSQWHGLQILALVAAVIYDSWPLGPWLNPAIGTKGLASELEATGQPYNWVFVGGDVVSSILILGLCYWLWRQIRSARRQKLVTGALIGTALFGIGTIVDALLPLNCDATLQVCPSFHQDHLLLIHGIFSIGASFFLFVGLALLWWQRRRNVVLNSVMFGYILFGLFSLISAIHPGQDSWSQHYYITLCSVVIALLPYLVRTELLSFEVASAKTAAANQGQG